MKNKIDWFTKTLDIFGGALLGSGTIGILAGGSGSYGAMIIAIGLGLLIGSIIKESGDE